MHAAETIEIPAETESERLRRVCEAFDLLLRVWPHLAMRPDVPADKQTMVREAFERAILLRESAGLELDPDAATELLAASLLYGAAQ
jgi:hypothetical protein